MQVVRMAVNCENGLFFFVKRTYVYHHHNFSVRFWRAMRAAFAMNFSWPHVVDVCYALATTRTILHTSAIAVSARTQ